MKKLMFGAAAVVTAIAGWRVVKFLGSVFAHGWDEAAKQWELK